MKEIFVSEYNETAQFPDEMSDDEIAEVLRKHYPPKQSFGQKAAEFLTGGHVSYGQEPPPEVESFPDGGVKINVPETGDPGFFGDPVTWAASAFTGGAQAVGKPLLNRAGLAAREFAGWMTGGVTEAPALAGKGLGKAVSAIEAKNLAPIAEKRAASALTGATPERAMSTGTVDAAAARGTGRGGDAFAREMFEQSYKPTEQQPPVTPVKETKKSPMPESLDDVPVRGESEYIVDERGYTRLFNSEKSADAAQLIYGRKGVNTEKIPFKRTMMVPGPKGSKEKTYTTYALRRVEGELYPADGVDLSASDRLKGIAGRTTQKVEAREAPLRATGSGETGVEMTPSSPEFGVDVRSLSDASVPSPQELTGKSYDDAMRELQAKRAYAEETREEMRRVTGERALPPGQGFELRGEPYGGSPVAGGVDDYILDDMISQLDPARGGSMEHVNRGGGWEMEVRRSGYPDWARRLVKEHKVSYATVANIIQRARAGAKLSPGQIKVYEAVRREADTLSKAPEYGRIIDDLAMQEEGFVRRDSVFGGELREGDEVVKGGERYRVTGEDGEGNIILKDGETIKVDPFDKVPVEGVRKQPTLHEFRTPAGGGGGVMGFAGGTAGGVSQDEQGNVYFDPKKALAYGAGGAVLGKTAFGMAKDRTLNPLKAFEKHVGTPAWDAIANKVLRRGLEKVPGGKSVVRAFDTKYRGDLPNAEAFNRSLKKTQIEQGVGHDYAMDLGKRLSALGEKEQLAVGEYLRGEASGVAKEIEPLANEAREALVSLGKQSVDLGLLKEDTFFKNLGKYFPRLYSTKEYQGLLNKFGMTKPNRLELERYMKRKDIPKEIRKEMGEILTPAYPVAKAVKQLTHDISLARMFRGIADNPQWAMPVEKFKAVGKVPEGFVRLPENRKLGKLSGAYVHPEIETELNAVLETRSGLERVANKLYGKWKSGKVVWSPKTHARNAMSNSVLAHLGGMPLYSQPKYLVQAIQDLRNQSDLYKQVRANSNIFQTSQMQAELHGLYDEVLRNLGGLPESGATRAIEAVPLMRQAYLAYKGTGQGLAKMYQMEEQVFKIAKIRHSMEKRGMGLDDAIEDAQKWLFDYGDVSRFQEKYRRSWYGAPFATFTIKALPRVAEAAIKTPWRFALPTALVYGIQDAAMRKIGDTREAFEAKRSLRPDYMQKETLGFPFFPRVPVVDEYGREYYLDLSYIMPWGDIAESGGRFGLPGALRPFSHPMTNEVMQQAMNYDPYWERPIVSDEDLAGRTGMGKFMKSLELRGKHALRTFAPTALYDATKIKAAASGEPDWRGREKSVPMVMLDALAGLKMSPVDYTEQAMRYISKSDPSRSDAAASIRRNISGNLMRIKSGKGDADKYRKEINNDLLRLHRLAIEVKEKAEQFQKAQQ